MEKPIETHRERRDKGRVLEHSSPSLSLSVSFSPCLSILAPSSVSFAYRPRGWRGRRGHCVQMSAATRERRAKQTKRPAEVDCKAFSLSLPLSLSLSSRSPSHSLAMIRKGGQRQWLSTGGGGKSFRWKMKKSGAVQTKHPE